MASRVYEWICEKRDLLAGNLWGQHTVAVEFSGLDEVGVEVLGRDLSRLGWSDPVKSGSHEWTATRRIRGKPSEGYLATCEADLISASRTLPTPIPRLRVWWSPINYARPAVWVDEGGDGTPRQRIVEFSGHAVPPWELAHRVHEKKVRALSYRAQRKMNGISVKGGDLEPARKPLGVSWGITAVGASLVLPIMSGMLGGYSRMDRVATSLLHIGENEPFWVWGADHTRLLSILALTMGALLSAVLWFLTFTLWVLFYIPKKEKWSRWKAALAGGRPLHTRFSSRSRSARVMSIVFVVLSSFPLIFLCSWVMLRMLSLMAEEFARNPGPALLAMVLIVLMISLGWLLLRQAAIVRRSVAKALFGGGGVLVLGVLASLPGWAYQQGLSLPFYVTPLPLTVQLRSFFSIILILLTYFLAWLLSHLLTRHAGRAASAMIAGFTALLAVLFVLQYTGGLWQRGADFVRTGRIDAKLSGTYPVAACLSRGEEGDPEGAFLPVWVLAKDDANILYIPLTGSAGDPEAGTRLESAPANRLVALAHSPEALSECSAD